MPDEHAMFCPLCGIALSFWGDERENGLDCHNCELTWHEDDDGHLFRCTCFADPACRLELVEPVSAETL